jgi:Uri superfamily endonuclease
LAYLDDLIEDCRAAKKAKPLKQFIMGEFHELKDIKSAIYIIRERNADTSSTFHAFQKFKKKKERACAKLNHPSSTLYVGSSTTGLMRRIKQHLGNGPKSTYALHLSHWAAEQEIEIEILQYNVPREVLQLIEDSISSELKPAFGKLGGNNK